MINKKEIIGITLDSQTKKLTDDFGEKHGLSRSAVIRLAVNEFFLKKELE
jgi:hypothetical protein